MSVCFPRKFWFFIVLRLFRRLASIMTSSIGEREISDWNLTIWSLFFFAAKIDCLAILVFVMDFKVFKIYCESWLSCCWLCNSFWAICSSDCFYDSNSSAMDVNLSDNESLRVRIRQLEQGMCFITVVLFVLICISIFELLCIYFLSLT